MLDFTSLSLMVTIRLFTAAALVMRIAGMKITRDINVVGDVTGLGRLARFSGPTPRASDLERLG
jgi:hypothetical protein